MAQTNDIVYAERKRSMFLGLPWTFTKYIIKRDMINVKKGFLKTEEDDCYMYKVTDVKLERSFLERILGVGTVLCYTGDVTDSTLKLQHIKNSQEIKEYILRASEEERMRRRTLNTQNISATPLDIEISHADGLDL
ncbi:MAG: PH domain-containing protein [Lachnospiraceae bacterium]|jgi:uncharacterized membrane protein YdbT with pleckstrin-like domain|nr:PH domain-containing protein [Lachnospiraceae bacterium]